MAIKTYVLLPHTDATAPVYRRVNKDTRVKLTKRPVDHAYLQITYSEKENKDDSSKPPRNRTLRLKLSSDTIYQDEQIKAGILANVPFTPAEKDAVKFTNGVLITKYDIVQRFLEAHPQCEGFDGLCDTIKRPLFKLYDKTIEIKNTNSAFRKRLEAANKVAAIHDLKEGQDLMIRLNGTFFKTPDNLEEVQNGLIDYLDEADDAMLDKLLNDSVTKDEETMILLGRAVAGNIISFDQEPNQVSLKKGDSWVSVKMVSGGYSPAERQRYFIEFLTSKDGELLLNDLRVQLDGSSKKKKEKV